MQIQNVSNRRLYSWKKAIGYLSCWLIMRRLPSNAKHFHDHMDKRTNQPMFFQFHDLLTEVTNFKAFNCSSLIPSTKKGPTPIEDKCNMELSVNGCIFNSSDSRETTSTNLVYKETILFSRTSRGLDFFLRDPVSFFFCLVLYTGS